jgi:hypothetical protein
VALWREALLAQAVLRGNTRGYRHHPQLVRFRDHPAPVAAISLYLKGIYLESQARGYTFDCGKIGPGRKVPSLTVTRGQLEHEWAHLQAKLKLRNPALYRKWRDVIQPQAHSIFTVCAGAVEAWEK